MCTLNLHWYRIRNLGYLFTSTTRWQQLETTPQPPRRRLRRLSPPHPRPLMEIPQKSDLAPRRDPRRSTRRLVHVVSNIIRPKVNHCSLYRKIIIDIVFTRTIGRRTRATGKFGTVKSLESLETCKKFGTGDSETAERKFVRACVIHTNALFDDFLQLNFCLSSLQPVPNFPFARVHHRKKITSKLDVELDDLNIKCHGKESPPRRRKLSRVSLHSVRDSS
ncbi:hypothetical protein RvY_17922-2 [Ramazzottius varieornatus]|uniref:Uncharacterized protein n=1 Tax=Ramazzottius varieornatus TaxID=947166 RepID=A0A1D1W5U2_RAMVA|nr:hypothetical protein RvY_17922-2 [Ramazzottius varieornatus]